MAIHDARQLANGLRTDHPVPGLPFVDDSHLPLEDPQALEAVGRRRGVEGTWGRTDPCPDGGWTAFATDPVRQDLAWVVRWHPEHGRSVLVYRDADASSVHMDYWSSVLLFRAGAYWWDGTTWFRPNQIWDPVNHAFLPRPVPAARTTTAADMLVLDDAGVPTAGDAARGRILTISDLPLQTEDGEDGHQADVDVALEDDGHEDARQDGRRSGRWIDDLAAWAAARRARPTTAGSPASPGSPGSPALEKCVVTINAPELSADQLVGATDMAKIGNVAASTLRAYIARGEADVPTPQAVINARPAWARAVAEEWAERRRYSTDSAEAAVSRTDDYGTRPAGVDELWSRYTRVFFFQLWERPGWRRRWALRWRTQDAVRDVAHGLAWNVAADLNQIIPLEFLGTTIRHALLDEFAENQRMIRADGHELTDNDVAFYGITPGVARMLDWLIHHDPARAHHEIKETLVDLNDKLDIRPAGAAEALRVALSQARYTDPGELSEFLKRTLATTPR